MRLNSKQNSYTKRAKPITSKLHLFTLYIHYGYKKFKG